MKTKTFILVFSIAVLMPKFTLSGAESAIAAGAIMEGIIDQLENSITTLIDQLDNRVSARSFQMRTELVFLQDEISHLAESLASKTFAELTKQQQIFFENATTTIASVEEGLNAADLEIDSLATQVEQISAQFPFVGSEPRVRRSDPTFLKQLSSNETTVPVRIEGSFLNHGEALLAVRKHNCKLTGHTDSSTSFVCPGAAFPINGNQVTYLSGRFVVLQERSFFEKMISFFGSEAPTKTYKIPFAVVPSRLGTYEIKATHLVDTKQSNTRTGIWGRTNDHCKGRQSFQYNFGPASAEWSVDVNSIKTSVTCERRGGHAVRNVSQNGFQIESWASNGGRCEKLLGSIVSKDGRGCSAGNVTWIETRVVPIMNEEVIKSGVLEWGKAVSVTLPSRLQGILITVNQIDGKTVVLNSATPSKWFTASRDGESTSLVLSPLEINEALR
ncbi:MAG: hypothetical protein P8171_18920 [Candidatus Thiodiazotropha sp.]